MLVICLSTKLLSSFQSSAYISHYFILITWTHFHSEICRGTVMLFPLEGERKIQDMQLSSYPEAPRTYHGRLKEGKPHDVYTGGNRIPMDNFLQT